MVRITMLFAMLVAMFVPASAQSVQEYERVRTVPNCCGGWDTERVHTRTENGGGVLRSIGGGLARVAPDIIWAGRDIIVNDRTQDSYEHDSNNRRAEVEDNNRTNVTTETIRESSETQRQRDAACADAVARAQQNGHMNARCRWVNGEMIVEVPRPRPVITTTTTKTTVTVNPPARRPQL